MDKQIKIVRKSTRYNLSRIKGGGVAEMYIITDMENGNISPPLKNNNHRDLIQYLKYKQCQPNWGNLFTIAIEFDRACEYILETGCTDYQEIKQAI